MPLIVSSRARRAQNNYTILSTNTAAKSAGVGGSSMTIANSSDPQVGQYMILTAMVGGGNTITTPTGWTSLITNWLVSNHRHYVYGRIADATDLGTPNYTLSASGNEEMAAVIAVTGVLTAPDYTDDQVGQGNLTSYNSHYSYPATGYNGGLVVACMSFGGGTPWAFSPSAVANTRAWPNNPGTDITMLYASGQASGFRMETNANGTSASYGWGRLYWV